MANPHISLITTFHREGRLAESTVKSWKEACAEAALHGLSVEWICILDKPDFETKNFCANRLNCAAKVVEVEFEDVGTSRNHGIDISAGEYICISDADDLVSGNWLAAAYEFLNGKTEKIVAHASLCVYFERELRLAKLPEIRERNQLTERLLGENLWTALVFAKRELFEAVPYPRIDVNSGFGYEDWLWNCQTVSENIEHRVVPDTVQCVRLKAWKPSLALNYQNSTLPVSNLFGPSFKQTGSLAGLP
jgi:Glycosyl transferase family 2